MSSLPDARLPEEPTQSVSPVASLILSVLFWGALGMAAALYGVLVLSPRLLESERLRLRCLKNQVELVRLRKETAHLRQVSEALRSDAEFRARVASSELHVLPEGRRHLPVATGLGYDPRIPATAEPDPAIQPVWYYSILESLAGSPEVRWRCGSAALAILLTAFFCLNDGFFSGSLGAVIAAVLHGLARRYRAVPAHESQHFGSES